MQNMTPMTEEQYAQHWSLESEKHQRFSDYSWMSKLLKDSTLILEIGCGNGASTKYLLQKKCRVIIIEVNNTLAMMAYERLTSLGYTGKITHNDEIDTELDFNIVVESVFSEIAENIVNSHNFDYIINWLFGASPYTIANEEGVDINQITFQSAPNYRLKSALRALELKKACKNSECKFHYVIRALYDKSTANSKDKLKASFAEEQLEDLGLEENEIDLSSIEIRKLESFSSQPSSSMKYVHTLPEVTLPKDTKPVLVSIII